MCNSVLRLTFCLITSLISVLSVDANIGSIIGTTVHNGMCYNIISDGTATLFGNLEEYGGNPNFIGPYVIPESVEYNGKSYRVDCINGAFCNIEGLTTLVIPKTIISVATSFSYCPNLKQIIFENGDEQCNITIANYYGSTGTGLEYLYIGRPVSGLTDLIKLGGNNLKEVIISGNSGSFSLTNFDSCPGLETVIIDRPLNWYSSSSFSLNNCTNLKNILFTENSQCSWIPANFSGCTSIRNIDIPSTVGGITGRAFNSCTNDAILVSRAKTPPVLDYFIFPVSNNNLVYVPSESMSSYYNADYWRQGYYTVNSITEPSSLSLSEDEIVLNIGESTKLTTNNIPRQYLKYWLSSDNTVATVYDGMITAVGPGECEISVCSDALQAQCHVKVVPQPSSIAINQNYLEINKGDKVKLDVTTSPSSIPGLSLMWSSSNSEVVTVDDSGEITGVGRGIATISVKTENNLSSSIDVKVNVATYSLSLDIPEGKYIIENLTQPFTFKVIPEEKWEIFSAKFNDIEVDLSNVTDGEFTTPSEIEDYKFSVVFRHTTTLLPSVESQRISVEFTPSYIHVVGKEKKQIVSIYDTNGIKIYEGEEEYIMFSRKGCFILSIGIEQFKFVK